MTNPVHEIRRVLAVVDGELRRKAETRRVFAQEARADGVKSARICRRRGRRRLGGEAAREEPLDPPDQLRGGPPGESREHDPLGIGAGEDQRRHPMGEHRRLARARPRNDEQRSRTF